VMLPVWAAPQNRYPRKPLDLTPRGRVYPPLIARDGLLIGEVATKSGWRGLGIDDQFECRRRLDGQITGLAPLRILST
jgi:hypothetical protein